MSRQYFTPFIVLLGLFNFAHAQSIVDCRIVTGDANECKQYASKLIHVKEIGYTKDRKKLIISKTLPVPKKTKVKVISVADMLEKYVKVEDSLRFKGTEVRTPSITVRKEPVAQDVVKNVIEKVTEKEITSAPIKKTVEKEKIYGSYKVVSGDVLGRIAKKFGLKTQDLLTINTLNKKKTLKLGQTLKIPFSQKTVDAISTGEYAIESGDTLISIARKFNVEPKALTKFNNIKSNTTIRVGKKLVLPLPYIVKKRAAKKLAEEKKRIAEKKKLAQAKAKRIKMIRGIGKRKLRVTATAYSSHKNQTDSTPFLAAWNNKLRPGMKIIAVSRDMLTRYGMRNGTKVRIGGLRGYYTVRDKMNKRYKKRIDIYMGLDRRRALRWGRRSVVIYW